MHMDQRLWQSIFLGWNAPQGMLIRKKLEIEEQRFGHAGLLYSSLLTRNRNLTFQLQNLGKLAAIYLVFLVYYFAINSVKSLPLIVTLDSYQSRISNY